MAARHARRTPGARKGVQLAQLLLVLGEGAEAVAIGQQREKALRAAPGPPIRYSSSAGGAPVVLALGERQVLSGSSVTENRPLLMRGAG